MMNYISLHNGDCFNLPLVGFITMTPQLFINYKLKSVAHPPMEDVDLQGTEYLH